MKSVEELIETKNWSELTSNERALIADLASNEEEFYQAKNFFESLQPTVEASQFETSNAVKSSLDKIFQAKHPGITHSWEAESQTIERKIIPLYQQGWFRIAAVLLIGGSLTTLFWKTSIEQNKTKPKLALELTDTNTIKSNTVNQENIASPTKSTTKFKESNLNKSENQDSFYSFPALQPLAREAKKTENYTSYELKNSAAESTFESTTMEDAVARGMDKDLNPYANDELTSEQREHPRPTETYFDILEPSF